jgi:hypothetical protein
MERTALRRPLGSPTPASGAVSDSNQRLGEICLTFKTRNGLWADASLSLTTRTARGAVPTLLRSSSPCQQFPHATRSVASGFLHITRFESDLGAVNFAIDLVVAFDEADILGLGATLERTGAAA